VTTHPNRHGGRRRTRGSTARPASSSRPRRKAPDRPARSPAGEFPPEAPAEAQPEEGALPPIPLSAVETAFAARVPPPEPDRPRPAGRRAIFLDVENTSKAQHLADVIDHLGVDPWDRRTELVAVANWRVVGHDAARLLAQRGAHLVHSAPSTGVRDWSDLRIAVAAGIWLAGARPGDLIEIVSDDRAFDAVGDVAASLGIAFRRLSYRRLAKAEEEATVPAAATPSGDRAGPRRRRRRRGRGTGHAAPPVAHRQAESRALPAPAAPPGRPGGARGRGGAPAHRPSHEAPHTAPHDELVSVVRGLVEASPRRSIVIDAVANALKARGFQRPPGSPRLITRLRRIRELLVSPSGTITLAADGGAPRDEGASEGGPGEALELEDRQPPYPGGPDRPPEPPEIDGNRKPPEDEREVPDIDGNRAQPPSRGPRRRRRRRGGQRRPVPGPPVM
jgi:hypothetical protein